MGSAVKRKPISKKALNDEIKRLQKVIENLTRPMNSQTIPPTPMMPPPPLVSPEQQLEDALRDLSEMIGQPKPKVLNPATQPTDDLEMFTMLMKPGTGGLRVMWTVKIRSHWLSKLIDAGLVRVEEDVEDLASIKMSKIQNALEAMIQ